MKTVADIIKDDYDALGKKISTVYGRKDRCYAVYGADCRIMVCFADRTEGDLAERQRKQMSLLAPLRGEIDGLVDGWRAGNSRSLLGARHSPNLRSKAERYDRRVADALVVALENGSETAGAIFAAIKQDIINERTARARFEYLIAAVLTAAALMFGAWLVTVTFGWVTDTALTDAASDARAAAANSSPMGHRQSTAGYALLLMALLGSVGLFFARWDVSPDCEAKTDKTIWRCLCDWSRSWLLDRCWWAELWNSLLPSVLLFAVIAIPIWALLLTPEFKETTSHTFRPEYQHVVALWRAASAGSVGAFFSIAIGIRGRTVLTDLLRTSNLMDAALRVSIGFIAAGIFEALLIRKLVYLQLGAVNFGDITLLGVLIAGFIAGFSERLVPDLLAKVAADTGHASPLPKPTQATPDKPDPDRKLDEKPSDAAKLVPADAPPDISPGEATEDGCVADHEIGEKDVTADRDLPPASGAVASADAGSGR